MNKFIKHLFLSLSLILSLTLLFSCKKDDASGNNGDGKNAKFTITVTGVNAADDYVSFIINGSDANNSKTLWKVNGVVQNNESLVSLGEDDFTGSTKTYVVESTLPLNIVNARMQCLNFNAAYTVSFKAEINGKVITNDQNISVDLNKDYTHMFDY